MIKNRLQYWSNYYILDDILAKTPYITPKELKLSPSIVINISSNKAITDKRRLIPIVLALELITGQKGLLTKAKYSLATFRLKKGMEIGVKITLKKLIMWNFLDKFIHLILPSLIYFNKFNKISYDRSGNLAIGIQDINIFPEIDWLRESQHLLTKLGFLTGADIIIIWNSSPIFSSKSGIKCLSSSFQLVVA